MEYPLNPPPPYTKNMNGAAERMIQTLNTTVRRCPPTAALGGRTPYEVLRQIIPTIHHLRRIGCIAYHRTPDENFLNKTALKFGPRSTLYMLVGYTESTKISKLWNITGQRAIRSADVIFIEQENEIAENMNVSPLLNPFPDSPLIEKESVLRPEVGAEHYSGAEQTSQNSSYQRHRATITESKFRLSQTRRANIT